MMRPVGTGGIHMTVQRIMDKCNKIGRKITAEEAERMLQRYFKIRQDLDEYIRTHNTADKEVR